MPNPPPASDPPRTDFNAFGREIVANLLGPAPQSYWGNPRDFRAQHPDQWPKDRTGREYLHRALGRLLSERGGTTEAAVSVQRDLEDGLIRTVVIDKDHGDEYPIEPRLWRAATTSAEMYWDGLAAVTASSGNRLGRFEGDIYVQTSEAADAPATAKPLELSESEALCRLLLHLARGRPAAQIAKNSVGTDYEVAERTVSLLLKRAKDFLREKAL